MVRLTLQGCKHGRVETWAHERDKFYCTCMSCYERLMIDEWPQKHGQEPLDYDPAPAPAFICNHPEKNPIPSNPRMHVQHVDVICMRCGCVLRHPDGPGSWEEVIFNGYVIREEPG